MDYMEIRNPGFRLGVSALTKGLKYGGGSVAIWALVLTDELEVKGEFELLRPQIDFPPHSYRLQAQQSVLTRLKHRDHVDLESYMVGRGLGNCLERYEISGDEVGTALKELTQMNITFASLFPDLGGAAQQTNITWTLELMATVPPHLLRHGKDAEKPGPGARTDSKG